ncbi:hypothetical protein SLE2022_028530 [Rubroshorea leprosula]
MADDWDLYAVVRSCATTTTSATCSSSAATRSDLHPLSGVSPLFSFPDPFEARNVVEELHQLYKPFFPKSQPLSPESTPISSISSLFGSKDELEIKQQQPQQQQQHQPKQSRAVPLIGTANTSTSNSTPNSSSSRSKRRKNQMKRVCQVPEEGLSSDVWAWRKYGQKPIKGSPFPRGYYRCSSSKGCLARKQVERNRSDPSMFIVTYTAEHNHPAPTHRNSLAGSTRQKPFTTQSITTASDSPKPSPAKPTTSSSTATSVDDELVPQSTRTEESREDVVEDEEEDDLGISDMAVSDDFFEGLDELTGPVPGDCFSDHFPANFGLPWIANSAATAAGGI